jgi:hypothetical protein
MRAQLLPTQPDRERAAQRIGRALDGIRASQPLSR